MNLTELETALRELRLCGMTEALETRLRELQFTLTDEDGAAVASRGDEERLRLSILVPLYNEKPYIKRVLEAVLRAPLPANMEREIIVVDDASTDGSLAAVDEFVAAHPTAAIQVVRKPRNEGKGAAIRTAIEHATGTYSLVQDADLEYDPREYRKLLNPLLEGHADAVFGSRFMVSGGRRVLYFWHSVANRILTLASNIASDLNLTDMETCYKVVRTDLLKTIPLRSNRFGFEPEITIKLAKRSARIYEVPVSYHGRTYKEGKKIGARDAFAAIYTILRFWISNDIYKASSHAESPAYMTGSAADSQPAASRLIGTHASRISTLE